MDSREEKNKEIQKELEKEELHEKTKKYVLLFLKITFIIILLFFLVYFYTYYSSTKGIVVKEERMIDPNLPESFHGVKVIQFSDLYYGTTIFQEELKSLVKQINIRKPDLVVFTGNIIEHNEKLSLKRQEQIIKELQKIDTTIGKYAIMGKEDDPDLFQKIMNQSNFKVLDNTYDVVYNQDKSPILMVGLSSYVNNKRNATEAFQYFETETHNKDIYKVVLMSETEDLDSILSSYQPHLVFAGNSLNGQVRLPFIGGIIKQKGSSKYTEPYYEVNHTKIYISSGIGSPDIGFRFLNNPSINFLRFVKSS